jgi:hypothetical protein
MGFEPGPTNEAVPGRVADLDAISGASAQDDRELAGILAAQLDGVADGVYALDEKARLGPPANPL